MASDHQQPRELEALILRIEASRHSLGSHAISLKSKLNVPSRLASSVRKTAVRNPLALFGGMAGAGFLISRFKRRPKETKRKRGIIGFLLGAVFAAIKPSLMRMITAELRKSLNNHLQQRKFASRATLQHPSPRDPLS